ncbi:MAG TPA: autotransporter outer membrane beta-barrel domain-containing protein, partial [Rhizomicrobium sp.]|nr:autotransporter outer membrane beta-barrel domain-containing protein [Rhizomicrobium sp.]
PKASGNDPATGGPDASYLGLTGYAAKMFPLANQALANDSTLGAEVLAAGNGLDSENPANVITGQKLYQGIYSAFAPDVTGADRAIAISITDQATGPVGARQRALRMYAGLDGDATLWGQQFGQRLNTGNSAETTGYANTGFGFALGADSGDPHDGRYGAAFTFYSGDTSEKAPRTSKTLSDWVLLTGYSDWRGHGVFFDSQLSAGYGQITGKRSIVIGNAIAECNGGETCTATGKRPAALLAGGVTAGTIYHSGGTVFVPQLSLDGMTMREDGYTESTPNLVTQATSGFDLHVKPFYASSLRAFAGADLRQDLKFGDYFVQPEARAGFRYDFLDGAEKLKAEFACSAVATGSCGNTAFDITGPDPAKGNLVLGGGIAVTTGAWSLGVSYDYLRGIDGVKSTDQTATLTLVGRI